MPDLSKWTTDLSALILRVAAGLIFIPHGYSKVFGSGGPAAFAADLPGYGVPAFLGYLAAYAEFFGAILLIVGLLTRLDAFLLAGTMFVAAFVVQLPDALRDPDNAGHRFFASMRAMELPLALLATMLVVLLMGPGRFSLDALIWRKKVGARRGAPATPDDR
jgi:putative oxidoreductase